MSFRSFDTGCGVRTRCVALVADTPFQQGQGMHGSFSRADTHNFMAAVGPSFRRQFVSSVPASNADVGMTVAHLLGLDLTPRGQSIGRVLTEALDGGAGIPPVESNTLRSLAATNGVATVLNYQTVGSVRYLTAAGFPGRAVGLSP